MSGAPYILLQLKAKHFSGTALKGNGLFYNAIRDIFRYRYHSIVENEDYIQVSFDKYSFCDEYTDQMYETDKKVAIENLYNDTPIRLIKLKKIINVTV